MKKLFLTLSMLGLGISSIPGNSVADSKPTAMKFSYKNTRLDARTNIISLAQLLNGTYRVLQHKSGVNRETGVFTEKEETLGVDFDCEFKNLGTEKLEVTCTQKRTVAFRTFVDVLNIKKEKNDDGQEDYKATLSQTEVIGVEMELRPVVKH